MEKRKIIQIVTPSAPIYAVFNIGKDKNKPTEVSDLLLEECPVVALIENTSTGDREVVPLELESWGINEPVGPDFLGYARDVEHAQLNYISAKA